MISGVTSFHIDRDSVACFFAHAHVLTGCGSTIRVETMDVLYSATKRGGMDLARCRKFDSIHQNSIRKVLSVEEEKLHFVSRNSGLECCSWATRGTATHEKKVPGGLDAHCVPNQSVSFLKYKIPRASHMLPCHWKCPDRDVRQQWA